MKRLTLATPLVLISILSMLIISEGHAWAADCNTEEVIFVANENQDTNDWTLNYGTSNKIKSVNRQVRDCGSSAIAGSTAHSRLGGTACGLVEIGYRIGFDLFGGKTYRIFSEWVKNCTSMAEVVSATHPCWVSGTYKWYRSTNHLGTTDWKLLYNCGSGWVIYDRFNGTGYKKAIPMGETFRFGGEQTGMYSEFPELERKFSGGGWHAWQWPECFDDNAAGWEPVANWFNNFDVVQGPSDC